MSERSKFIKVRVTEGEYKTLRQRADAKGATMSEYVRDTVKAVHQTLDVAAELSALRSQMRQAPTVPERHGQVSDTEQLEILLLLRELAAARDAQILFRVRAQLASKSGNTQRRGGAV